MMNDLFTQLMQRHMGSQEVPAGTPAPPSSAVGLWSQYQPPPPNRPQGWTLGQAPKPQPNQQTQAIGAGPGAATPPGPMNRG